MQQWVRQKGRQVPIWCRPVTIQAFIEGIPSFSLLTDSLGRMYPSHVVASCSRLAPQGCAALRLPPLDNAQPQRRPVFGRSRSRAEPTAHGIARRRTLAMCGLKTVARKEMFAAPPLERGTQRRPRTRKRKSDRKTTTTQATKPFQSQDNATLSIANPLLCPLSSPHAILGGSVNIRLCLIIFKSSAFRSFAAPRCHHGEGGAYPRPPGHPWSIRKVRCC